MPTSNGQRRTRASHLQPVKPDRLRHKPAIRAYPGNMELLTEHGFYRFDDLYDGNLLAGEAPFEGKGFDQSFKGRELPWSLYQPDADFPKVATVNPVGGAVTYVTPTLFRVFTYDDYLVQMKARGVDIVSTRYADAFVRARYARAYGFNLFDNLARLKSETASYAVIDKFTQNLYGEYEPREDLVARLDAPKPMLAKHAAPRRIEDTYGQGSRVDRLNTEVEVFNVDVAPFHTVIVRKGKTRAGDRGVWTGNPVVMGDGSDKSEMRIERLQALREHVA